MNLCEINIKNTNIQNELKFYRFKIRNKKLSIVEKQFNDEIYF